MNARPLGIHPGWNASVETRRRSGSTSRNTPAFSNDSPSGPLNIEWNSPPGRRSIRTSVTYQGLGQNHRWRSPGSVQQRHSFSTGASSTRSMVKTCSGSHRSPEFVVTLRSSRMGVVVRALPHGDRQGVWRDRRRCTRWIRGRTGRVARPAGLPWRGVDGRTEGHLSRKPLPSRILCRRCFASPESVDASPDAADHRDRATARSRAHGNITA